MAKMVELKDGIDKTKRFLINLDLLTNAIIYVNGSNQWSIDFCMRNGNEYADSDSLEFETEQEAVKEWNKLKGGKK